MAAIESRIQALQHFSPVQARGLGTGLGDAGNPLFAQTLATASADYEQSAGAVGAASWYGSGSALSTSALGTSALGTSLLGRPAQLASSPAASTSLNTALTATPRSPGDYGSMTVPAALGDYQNGRLPEGALAAVGIGSHRLWGPAADAFVQMRQAAAADGVTLDITDSYRSYDEQVDLARRKGLYSQGGLAATPGRSNHGWGLAIDVDVDDAGQAWLAANGWKYGWVETVPREPWHFEFRPDALAAASSPTASTTASTAAPTATAPVSAPAGVPATAPTTPAEEPAAAPDTVGLDRPVLGISVPVPTAGT